VSTSKPAWEYDDDALARTLAKWREENPTRAVRDIVNDGLMDCLANPLTWGAEDPNSPGVFFHRFPGTNVGLVYTVNIEERRVHPALLGEGPPSLLGFGHA
jgi:hypothetical protein